jgi:hypothetical protein
LRGKIKLASIGYSGSSIIAAAFDRLHEPVLFTAVCQFLLLLLPIEPTNRYEVAEETNDGSNELDRNYCQSSCF